MIACNMSPEFTRVTWIERKYWAINYIIVNNRNFL